MREDENFISADKEYEMIVSRVGAVWATTYDGVRLFIQVFSVILGGCIWLRLQLFEAHVVPRTLFLLTLTSDFLVFLLTSLCSAMTWDNLGTWWLWRKRLDFITEKGRAQIHIQAGQRGPREVGSEATSCAFMFVVWLLFIWLNPFRESALIEFAPAPQPKSQTEMMQHFVSKPYSKH